MALIHGSSEGALYCSDGAVVFEARQGSRTKVPVHDLAHIHAIRGVEPQFVSVCAFLLAGLVILFVLAKHFWANDLIPNREHKKRDVSFSSQNLTKGANAAKF